MFLHTCYMYVCFQFVAFVWEHVWHKAFLMGQSMRLELTLVSRKNDTCLVSLTRESSSLIKYPIKKTLCHTCSLTKAASWKYIYIYIYIYIYYCWSNETKVNILKLIGQEMNLNLVWRFFIIPYISALQTLWSSSGDW